MADDALRSRLISDMLRQRKDLLQHRLIDEFVTPLDFTPIDELMISSAAWDHVQSLYIEPKIVFAHPILLRAHPSTSLYYRGMALLSLKRVKQGTASSVDSWEAGSNKNPIREDSARKVASLYNTMISSIIEGSSKWTLDNGYRNIVATMGISFDGMFRNQIGDIAEKLVKNRLVEWLKAKGLLPEDCPDHGGYLLPRDTIMNFGSEPDIDFTRGDHLVATIEVKGGRDPAGALERLGAMTKSFKETPPDCVNFLVAGIITTEMKKRLDAIGNVKVYLLDDISQDGEKWEDFTNEVFHHAVRVI